MYHFRYIAYFFILVLAVAAGLLIYQDQKINVLSGILLGIVGLSLIIVLIIRPLMISGLKEAVEETQPDNVPQK
jgi:membrane protein YdbS with pleckstrin-like domain